MEIQSLGQTQVKFVYRCRQLGVINIELRLDLDIFALIIALKTNLESGPWFAEVWFRWLNSLLNALFTACTRFYLLSFSQIFWHSFCIKNLKELKLKLIVLLVLKSFFRVLLFVSKYRTNLVFKWLKAIRLSKVRF